MDRHLKITSLPPLTCERISKLLTHDPNALISPVLEIALKVSENYAYDDSEQDMCVVCNSDMLEEGSGFRDCINNLLSSGEKCLVTSTNSV